MKLLRTIFLILIFAAVCFGNRGECFPFERLEPKKRQAAEDLLLKALDSEALYTIIDGLKPMSSGFANFWFEVREPRDLKKKDERDKTLSDIAETREILAHFRCGELFFSDVQHFAKTFEGKRASEAVIFHRQSLSRKIMEKADFFERWGITPNSHPLEVLYSVEYDETVARFGGYGFLFGYPDYAVRFFVEAAAEENFTGKFVERDFYSIPTFSNPTNRFVYAVPKGHRENETDKALKEKALLIFEDYKKRRAKYIGEGKKGVVEMMRDWLCEERRSC